MIDNTEDNSFDTTDLNSFMTSNSKKSSRRSQRSRSFKSSINDAYIMQLERKIDVNYKLQQDNTKLLNYLLSSTIFSSINKITEPSTKVSFIDEFQKSTIKNVNTTINHTMSYPPTVEMQNVNVEERETNKNAFDLDSTKLATVIASAVNLANPITILRIPPFNLLDIKSYLYFIIT